MRTKNSNGIADRNQRQGITEKETERYQSSSVGIVRLSDWRQRKRNCCVDSSIRTGIVLKIDNWNGASDTSHSL